MRYGSSPDFCPPVEEGMVIKLADEAGDEIALEFLGLIISDDHSYGCFFPVTEDAPAGSNGEVVILEVVEFTDDGQPAGFELIEDEELLMGVYEKFAAATKDLYDFE